MNLLSIALNANKRRRWLCACCKSWHGVALIVEHFFVIVKHGCVVLCPALRASAGECRDLFFLAVIINPRYLPVLTFPLGCEDHWLLLGRGDGCAAQDDLYGTVGP